MLAGMNTKARVIEALERNGYSDHEIITATFVKHTDGGLCDDVKEQHVITFLNDNTGKVDSGFVYVWIHQGKLIADY